RATEAAPADARPAIEGETRRLQQVIDSLMRNVEIRSVTGRDEQGRVTKTEFRTLRKPSDVVDRSFARVGQLMGAMMVVHSVQELGTSLAGFQSGQVNLPETVFQVAHAGYNINIGLRMVRLAPVHPGEFVAVAALEVGAVLLSDTGTEAERNYRLAVVGVEQLCMAAGMAIMHGGSLIPHLGAKAVVMGLGLAITLAGPRVLSWLGLDAWLARVTDFRPTSVAHVFQDIQDTLDEYQAIIGAADLAERSDEQLRGVGASDPAALRQQAGEARSRHIERAHRKEAELIGLFRQAYQDAGTSYAGLRDLDAMAARFARLRHLALPADANRQATQSDFASMDPANADLGNSTPQQIRDMDQWKRLNRELNNLDNALRASPVKWPKIYEYLDNCHEIMDNARYRVDSASGGYRPDPMIPKGSPAYDAYLSLLSSFERRHGRLMARLAELGGAGDVYYLPDATSWDHQTGDPLAAVSLLQSLRSAYDQRVNEASTELPGLASPEAWSDSNVLMHRLE